MHISQQTELTNANQTQIGGDTSEGAAAQKHTAHLMWAFAVTSPFIFWPQCFLTAMLFFQV